MKEKLQYRSKEGEKSYYRIFKHLEEILNPLNYILCFLTFALLLENRVLHNKGASVATLLLELKGMYQPQDLGP